MLACLQIAALDVRVRNLSYFKIQVSAHMSEIYSRAAVDVSKWSVFSKTVHPSPWAPVSAHPHVVNHGQQ